MGHFLESDKLKKATFVSIVLDLLINNAQNLSIRKVMDSFQDVSDGVWTAISDTEERARVEPNSTVPRATYARLDEIADRVGFIEDEVHYSVFQKPEKSRLTPI